MSDLRIVAIVEARLGSSRLPGKVLLEAAGKPLLSHLVSRLRAVPSIDEIVIATTVNRRDNQLVDFALREGISVFRGDEEDVMSRVLGAAEKLEADLLVNITGDCPLLDPVITEQVIRLFLNNDCDYATNGHVRTFPGGYAVQVYTIDTLQRSYKMTIDPLEREHVTLHIRRNPEIFKHIYLPAPPNLHWPELNLALDEESDYILLCKIFEYFKDSKPDFGCLDVVTLLNNTPNWLEINRDVIRKGDT